MKRHLVTFYSPGTFFSEETSKVIDSWDVEKAVEMSKTVLERYDARPYGFRFSTSEQKDGEWGIKEVAKSPMYWLGGTIYTLEELESKNDPDDRILISNLKSNHYTRCIVNTNSWKFTGILEDEDIILEIQ